MIRNILIVGNDEASQTILKAAVKNAGGGYDLHFVTNGEEALRLLRLKGNDLPGMVILDLMLPGKNGVEILGEMKKDKALEQIPVLILTGSSDPTHMEACAKFPRCKYVVKPPHFSELVEIVKSFPVLFETAAS